MCTYVHVLYCVILLVSFMQSYKLDNKDSVVFCGEHWSNFLQGIIQCIV